MKRTGTDHGIAMMASLWGLPIIGAIGLVLLVWWARR